MYRMRNKSKPKKSDLVSNSLKVGKYIFSFHQGGGRYVDLLRERHCHLCTWLSGTASVCLGLLFAGILGHDMSPVTDTFACNVW